MRVVNDRKRKKKKITGEKQGLEIQNAVFSRL
jgi:hypothetical protein